MKRIALYIILFSYTAVILKPVTPYITDAVAHIFYYAQHMATVHYEDGNFHVHKEVMQKAKKTEKQTEAPASKRDNSTSDHISIQQKTAIASSEPYTFYFLHSNNILPDNYLQGDYPPPRI